MSRHLTVFEHEIVEAKKGKGEILLDSDFEALNAWQKEAPEEKRTKYVERRGNTLKFSQWVGVLQVGDLLIEVLPKIDKKEAEVNNDKQKTEQNKWRDFLIQLLQATNRLPAVLPDAALVHEPDLLLQVYLYMFLAELKVLQHRGLVKKYRKKQGNSTAMKGRLVFGKHIQQNVVHKERFYVEYTTYDYEHLLHQVLYKALLLVPRLGRDGDLMGMQRQVLLDFPEMPNIKVTAKTFQRLKLNRKTKEYAKALRLAKMLLLNYYPNLSNGEDAIFALLFDMNRLWEDYVGLELEQNSLGWQVKSQKKREFWSADRVSKHIKADFLLTKIGEDHIVLDAKWKCVESAKDVADGDLKQLYVYNHYYSSKKAFLVYPSITAKAKIEGVFGDIQQQKTDYKAGIIWVDILEPNKRRLKQGLGKEIMEKISGCQADGTPAKDCKV